MTHKLVLSVEDVNKILSYLGQRPYVEVAPIINLINQNMVKEKVEKDKVHPLKQKK